MCIIALKPEGVVISDTTLKTMWDGNPHGAGFMYAEHGQLVICKGLMHFDDFLGALLDAGTSRKMVMHFRIRTSGTNGPEMTHPFLVSDGLGMVHNGIISKVDTTFEKSDTAVFAEMVAQEFTNPAGAVRNKFHRDMIGAYIGSYNKLVFMDSTGETNIVNESSGTWDRDTGVWYSNGGYVPYERLLSSSNTRYTSRQWEAATCGDAEDVAQDAALANWIDDNEPGWLTRATAEVKNPFKETPAKPPVGLVELANNPTSTTVLGAARKHYATREELWDAAKAEREELPAISQLRNRKAAKERAMARRQRVRSWPGNRSED